MNEYRYLLTPFQPRDKYDNHLMELYNTYSICMHIEMYINMTRINIHDVHMKQQQNKHPIPLKASLLLMAWPPRNHRHRVFPYSKGPTAEGSPLSWLACQKHREELRICAFSKGNRHQIGWIQDFLLENIGKSMSNLEVAVVCILPSFAQDFLG